MKNDLVQSIRKIRSKRASDYGNLAYQNVSGDIELKRIPEELWKLWYDRDSLSFVSIDPHQDLEVFSESELQELYNKEVELLKKLESAFSKL